MFGTLQALSGKETVYLQDVGYLFTETGIMGSNSNY